MVSRVPSSSMTQAHLTHITPLLSVKLVSLDPTMLTGVCSWEGPTRSHLGLGLVLLVVS